MKRGGRGEGREEEVQRKEEEEEEKEEMKEEDQEGYVRANIECTPCKSLW